MTGHYEDGWFTDTDLQQDWQPRPSRLEAASNRPTSDEHHQVAWPHDRRPTWRQPPIVGTSSTKRIVVDQVVHLSVDDVDLIVRLRYLDTTVDELHQALVAFSAIRPDDVLYLKGELLDGDLQALRSGLSDGSRLLTAATRPPGFGERVGRTVTVSGFESVRPVGGSEKSGVESGRYLTESGLDAISAYVLPRRHHLASSMSEEGVRQPFERPPRPARHRRDVEFSAPTLTQVSTANTAFLMMIMSALAPAAIGIALYFALHSLLYLLIMLGSVVSPVLMYLAQRWTSRVLRRNAKREFQENLDGLRRELGKEQVIARRDREDRFANIARVTDVALVYAPDLWCRRFADEDFLTLVAGYGEANWDPPVTDIRDPEVAEVVEAYSTLSDAVVTADLREGSLGVSGLRLQTVAVVRALILQIFALHGPADCDIAVIADPDRNETWEWLKWLPHTRKRGGGGLAMTQSHRADSPDEVAASLIADVRTLPDDRERVRPPVRVVIFDAPQYLRAHAAGPLRRLLSLEGPDLRLIAVAEHIDELPVVVKTVVELDSSGRSHAKLRTSRIYETSALRPCGIDTDVAIEAARAIARLEDPLQYSAGSFVPESVRLPRLLGLEDATSNELVDRWDPNATYESLPLLIGVGESGPVTIDLVAHGPHVLIGGTTGSGKSELLSTMVSSLAAAVPPSHLSMLLFDFKGGATFKPFESLPHVIKVISDLDGSQAERALQILSAEVSYRKRTLAGIADIREYRRRQLLPDGQGMTSLPRLLVMIDEFGEMRNYVEDYDKQLASIARIGRSLGIHLVLSTQTPSESVKQAISDNSRIRMALRLQTSSESQSLLGVRDAVDIPSALPGRCLALFNDRLVLFQSPYATASSHTGASAPVDILRFTISTYGGPERAFQSSSSSATSTDLSQLTDLISKASSEFGKRFPAEPQDHRPWSDELPYHISLAKVNAIAQTQNLDNCEAPSVVVDDINQQQWAATGWFKNVNHLLIVGAADTGKSTALATVVAAEIKTCGPQDLLVYVVEPAEGKLSALGPLRSYVCATIRTEDGERLRRLLDYLHSEMLRRRESLQGERVGIDPSIIVCIDGYASVLSLLFGDEDAIGKLKELIQLSRSLRIHFACTTDRADICGLDASSGRWPQLWFNSEVWALRSNESLPLAARGIISLSSESSRHILQTLQRSGRGRIYMPRIEMYGQVAADGIDVARTLVQDHPRPVEQVVNTIEPLPQHLTVADLPSARNGPLGREIPIGISIRTGHLAWLTLAPHTLMLVAGQSEAARIDAVQILEQILLTRFNFDLVVQLGYSSNDRIDSARENMFPLTEAEDAFNRAADHPGSRLLIVRNSAALSGMPSVRPRDRILTSAPGLIILAESSYDRIVRAGWALNDLLWSLGRTGLLLAPTAGNLANLELTQETPLNGDASLGHRGFLVNSNESRQLELVRFPDAHGGDGAS